MKKKKILVVGQFFYPEPFRSNDLCSEWVKRGYDVSVVSGTPNYPHGKFYDGYGFLRKRKEVYNGIKITRIPQIPRFHSKVGLILNYLSFVVSGFFWSRLTLKKADLVFNYETSPILHALPAVWFAKRRGVPFYIYILDLWPHSFTVMTGIKSKVFLYPLQKVCDYVYENADKIFVSSEGFVEEIKKRGVPQDKLVFWPQYAEELYKPVDRSCANVPEIPDDGKFNIIFAGNFGYAQGLEILPDTAELIKKNGDDIRICMVGDGRFKETLLKLVKEKDVEDVFCFIDRQPASRIPEFLARSDAALVILQKSELFEMTIPAKLQSCMACGSPIVLSVGGEAERILKNAGCGIACKASDPEALYDAMKEMASKSEKELNQMGENAIEFFEKNYNKEKLLEQMDKFLSI